MKCLAFKALARGSLQEFADLAMDSGLVLLGCTMHRSNEKAWVNPPSKPMIDGERKLFIGDDGRVAYSACIEFVDKRTRYKWSEQAVAAIEAAYPECKAPADKAGAMNGKDEPTAIGGRRHG